MSAEKNDRWLRWTVLLFLAVAFAYAPLAYGTVRLWDRVLVQACVAAGTLLTVVRFCTRNEKSLNLPPLLWGVLAFAFYAVARYLTADIEYVARLELQRVITLSLVIWLLALNLVRREAADWISALLIVIGVGMSVLALYQFMTHSARVWNWLRPQQYLAQGSGTFMNPNTFAGYISMVLPLALAYVLVGRMPLWLRLIAGYLCVVLVAGLGVSLSRAGWIAGAGGVGLVLFAVFRQVRRRWMVLAVAVLMLAGAALFLRESVYSKVRWADLFKSGGSVGYRLDLWHSAKEVWQDHFWMGGGPGHFDTLFTQHRPVTIQARPLYAHNDLLNALADWGLAGTLILTGCILLAGYLSVRLMIDLHRRAVSKGMEDTMKGNRLALVLGASGGMLALLLHGLMDFSFQVYSTSLIFCALMGMVAGQSRWITSRHEVASTPLIRWGICAVLVSAGLFLTMASVRSGREAGELLVVEQNLEGSPARLMALRRAFAAEPQNGDTAYQIAEHFRQQSWLLKSDFKKTGSTAFSWYRVAAELNPLDASTRLHGGMTLDWIGRSDEAVPWIVEGSKLDPNSYYATAIRGWHHFQRREFVEARQWLKRSQDLQPYNPVSLTYLRLTDIELGIKPGSKGTY
ncbi:MAG TPA: O-antigen ligase family protein [Roseimicrobium sp.]|nr:O-antigen ligase family protein [Roseimicrobium sp.]